MGQEFNFNFASFDPTTYTQCAYQSAALTGGETKTFTCSQPIVGRYVTVHFPTTKTAALTVCEVEVYGQNTVQPDGKLEMHFLASLNK